MVIIIIENEKRRRNNQLVEPRIIGTALSSKDRLGHSRAGPKRSRTRVFLETEAHTKNCSAKSGGWEENRIGVNGRRGSSGQCFSAQKGKGGGGSRRRKSELDAKSKLSIRKALEEEEEEGKGIGPHLCIPAVEITEPARREPWMVAGWRSEPVE